MKFTIIIKLYLQILSKMIISIKINSLTLIEDSLKIMDIKTTNNLTIRKKTINIMIIFKELNQKDPIVK
jgi:hypothetical protein